MWAALDPMPPSPTMRTDALVIRSMPSLAGDDDDDNDDDDDDEDEDEDDNKDEDWRKGSLLP